MSIPFCAILMELHAVITDYAIVYCKRTSECSSISKCHQEQTVGPTSANFSSHMHVDKVDSTIIFSQIVNVHDLFQEEKF